LELGTATRVEPGEPDIAAFRRRGSRSVASNSELTRMLSRRTLRDARAIRSARARAAVSWFIRWNARRIYTLGERKRAPAAALCPYSLNGQGWQAHSSLCPFPDSTKATINNFCDHSQLDLFVPPAQASNEKERSSPR